MNLLKYIIPFIACIAHLFPLCAQNLVPNGDFEQYSACPWNVSQLTLATPWKLVLGHNGTSDYFNECATSGSVDVPQNVLGYEFAHSGKGYAGHILYQQLTEYREYLMIELTNSLEKDSTYIISFYGALGDHSGITIKNYGIYLHNTAPITSNSFGVLKLLPQFETADYIYDTSGWTRYEFYYTASGGEKFMVMGNFRDDTSTDTRMLTGPLQYAYVYVDDVSIKKTCVKIKGPQVSCAGDTSTFYVEAGTGNVYGWANSQNPSVLISTDSFLTVSPPSTSTYLLYARCDTISFRLKVIPKPISYLWPDTTSVCDADSILFDLRGYGYKQIIWQDGNHDSIYFVSKPGTYYVEVYDQFCHTKDSVLVKACPCTEQFSNVFTPDNDLINDSFRPQVCVADDYHLTILNRWGEIVFESIDFRASWDGKSKGKPVAEGTYYWILNYFSVNENKPSVRTGTVTLIR